MGSCTEQWTIKNENERKKQESWDATWHWVVQIPLFAFTRKKTNFLPCPAYFVLLCSISLLPREGVCLGVCYHSRLCSLRGRRMCSTRNIGVGVHESQFIIIPITFFNAFAMQGGGIGKRTTLEGAEGLSFLTFWVCVGVWLLVYFPILGTGGREPDNDRI